MDQLVLYFQKHLIRPNYEALPSLFLNCLLNKCPRPGCNGSIVARKTKGRGKEFYGCTNYPECDFITHFKPIDVYCPKCKWFLVEKYDKKNGSYKSCINPDCDYLHSADEAIAAEAAGAFALANAQDKKVADEQ